MRVLLDVMIFWAAARSRSTVVSLFNIMFGFLIRFFLRMSAVLGVPLTVVFVFIVLLFCFLLVLMVLYSLPCFVDFFTLFS